MLGTCTSRLNTPCQRLHTRLHALNPRLLTSMVMYIIFPCHVVFWRPLPISPQASFQYATSVILAILPPAVHFAVWVERHFHLRIKRQLQLYSSVMHAGSVSRSMHARGYRHGCTYMDAMHVAKPVTYGQQQLLHRLSTCHDHSVAAYMLLLQRHPTSAVSFMVASMLTSPAFTRTKPSVSPGVAFCLSGPAPPSAPAAAAPPPAGGPAVLLGSEPSCGGAGGRRRLPLPAPCSVCHGSFQQKDWFHGH